MRRGIPENEDYPFDPEIERTLRRRRRYLREVARIGIEDPLHLNGREVDLTIA